MLHLYFTRQPVCAFIFVVVGFVFILSKVIYLGFLLVSVHRNQIVVDSLVSNIQ